MNTTELIIEVARRTQSTRVRLTRREVQHVVDELLDVIQDELTRPSGEIRLKRFGVFAVVEARLPAGRLRAGTSEQQHVSTGKVYSRVRFHPSRALSRALRKNTESS